MADMNVRREGEAISIETSGLLVVTVGGAMELAVKPAIIGSGVISLFDAWLRPALDSSRPEPRLQPGG